MLTDITKYILTTRNMSIILSLVFIRNKLMTNVWLGTFWVFFSDIGHSWSIVTKGFLNPDLKLHYQKGTRRSFACFYCIVLWARLPVIEMKFSNNVINEHDEHNMIDNNETSWSSKYSNSPYDYKLRASLKPWRARTLETLFPSLC